MPQSPDFAELLEHKREEVGAKKARHSLDEIAAAARAQRPPRSLAGVLAQPGVSLVAEVKRQSFARASYSTQMQPRELARLYADNGAAAISVMADQRFFGGGAAVVEQAVAGAAGAVPVIYKDFVVDPYQVAEARALGADAVLIVARIVDPAALHDCIAHTHELGMDCVVEVFDQDGAETAIAEGARIVGINNRNLLTSAFDFAHAAEVRATLPPGVLTISESGLRSAQDVRQAARYGFDAVLIGEALLDADDVGGKVRELSAAARAEAGAGT